MSVSDALDAMRSEISGCSLVAYADLGSRLVLCTSAVSNPGQEQLDALSGAALLALDGALAEGAAAMWDKTATGADMAMLLTNAEARVFLRSPGAAPEALICVCAADADLDKVVDCGQTTLSRILSQSEG
ncbi:MAG: hypothetical protein HKN18_12485 [Silicimonas sp.]|nr:hypothetical protein [Silicimonas sp.]